MKKVSTNNLVLVSILSTVHAPDVFKKQWLEIKLLKCNPTLTVQAGGTVPVTVVKPLKISYIQIHVQEKTLLFKSSKFALDKACTYTIHLFINTVKLYPSLTCIFSMGKYICPNSSVLSIAPREKRMCNLFFELMVWSKELLNLQKKAELCFEGGPDLTYDLYCETCLILVAGHSHNLAKFTSLPPICQQNTMTVKKQMWENSPPIFIFVAVRH